MKTSNPMDTMMASFHILLISSFTNVYKSLVQSVMVYYSGDKAV